MRHEHTLSRGRRIAAHAALSPINPPYVSYTRALVGCYSADAPHAPQALNRGLTPNCVVRAWRGDGA